MSFFDAIDNYCERMGAGLLAEPLNALSNLSFFIAAWLLYKIYKAKSVRDPESLTLIILTATVGTGSLLFHTFATRLTMLADIIPIGIFVFYYLWVSLRRLLNTDRCTRITSLSLFTAIAVLASGVSPPYTFNGSISYFPCLAAIILIGVFLKKRSHPAAAILFKAALWFAVSLTFRSVDMALCPAWPIGTHIFWHLCNGVVMYQLTKAILTTPAASAN